MSAPNIIPDNLSSLCQKLSDLVDVWRSYNKNNFACFFFWDTVYIHRIRGFGDCATQIYVLLTYLLQIRRIR